MKSYYILGRYKICLYTIIYLIDNLQWLNPPPQLPPSPPPPPPLQIRPDAKKTLASHLYRRLLSCGLRVFLDQSELQQGDYLTPQIQGAIASASVHVAILSVRYAESTWCLDELLQMLESNSPVIPVFYHVKPADLRWTRGKAGMYAQALDELEKKTTIDPQTGEEKLRHDSTTIDKWRDALSTVAGISGFELEAYNGDEGELVDKIVEKVLKKVKRPALEVATHPTGLDDKLEDFVNSVLQSGKAQILGIVGLGGVGKTTMAKEFFNKKNSVYNKTCFLFDVRDNKNRLNSLQRILIKSLTGLDDPINSVPEGTGLLRRHLSSTNALVIIDDVDHEDQIDALLPHQTVLHSNSLILITSRNMDVLKKRVEDTSIYKLIGLNTPHSRELFCCHAFNQPDPLPGFESLVEEFLKTCDGLPLSLKVFGALLYKNDDSGYWQYLLDNLEVPSDIQDKLKISYESLNKMEQQIFLDIACFFIGEDRDTAIKIWDGSGWKGLWGFQNIENKCLVEVNRENKIKMHDHLGDMGREIANASLPRRLCGTRKEIKDFLQESSATNKVRGIRIHDGDGDSSEMRDDKDSDIGGEGDSSEMPRYKRSRDCVMKLCNKQYPLHGLQLLHAEGVLVECFFRKVQSPNLIWLRWNNCPYSSLPSWISLTSLRVLQVQGEILETLWENESPTPLQLRELKIHGPLLNIPKSIQKLKHLERIQIVAHFWVDSTLTKLPEELCSLQSLKVLELQGFSEMKSLPECFGNLTNLQRISLFGFTALERLPDSFCKLVKLQYLHLEGCSNLTMSSETLENISTLLYLNLSGCGRIEIVPLQVKRQRSLEELHLQNMKLKELPHAIGELSDLEVLEVGGLPPSLCLLDTLPPSLCELGNLKVLKFMDMEFIYLPNCVGYLKKLEILEIWRCKALKCLPPSLGLLTQLTELMVYECPLISELPFKGEVKGERATSILPRLRRLTVRGTGISEVSFAEGVCFNLRELNLYGPLNLRKIDGIYGLAKLQQLSIGNCRELGELLAIETLVSLCYLDARGCVKLKSIRGLGQLRKLQYVNVEGCKELEEVEGIQHCRSVRTLDVRRCSKLQWSAELVEQLRQRLQHSPYFGEDQIPRFRHILEKI